MAFCGKPHNSLPGMLHGDEPCSCRPGIPRFQSWEGVNNEAMNVIADNTELAENFAETVKREIANDDGSYAHIGFHLANDIRNQSPASEVLLTLCGWNTDTLLDKTPPIAIED